MANGFNIHRFQPVGGRLSGTQASGSRPTAPTSSGLTIQDQEQFLYLFERVSEPLYFGPRGSSNIFFDEDTTELSEAERRASEMMRAAMPQTKHYPVSKPSASIMPNLRRIASMCRKDQIFSYFVPAHREAVMLLKSSLIAAPSRNEFLGACVATRDSSMVNSKLWIHAAYSAILSRPDMRGIKLPALWEVLPELFVDNMTKKMALQQSALPEQARSVIQLNRPKERVGQGDMTQLVINDEFSGRHENPENKLWYYREDLSLASHHWHWHIIYAAPTEKTKDQVGRKSRKGELFYYMHHNMIARYDAERLCNGLARVRPLDITSRPVLEEGYFSKLTSDNSGRNWGTRQEDTLMKDVNRQVGEANLAVDIEDLRVWKDRILEAIDTGMILNTDGKTEPLQEPRGIDILGALIENGGLDSKNMQYYGNLHNTGHVVIASSHDPDYRHREELGPMGDEATAQKDPAFYRWHKFIDNIFDKYKRTQPAYKPAELGWGSVRLTNVEVRTTNLPPNTMSTHWGQTDVDLSRGLDLARSNDKGPVWARVSHLDHKPFQYNFQVTLNATSEATATFRVFMAPKYNEQGRPFTLEQQYLLFFEMDKFSFRLKPGSNTIKRDSADSSVTIPWEQSFRQIEADLKQRQMDGGDISPAVCGCGWPQHLLLPKGTVDGFIFDLFVIVTDGAQDRVPAARSTTCKESVSYCGILDQEYPDKMPMGFPFDRKPEIVTESRRNAGTSQLDAFLAPYSNMRVTQVKVIHDAKTTIVRPGGAGEMPPGTVFVSSDSTKLRFDRSAESSPDRFE